MNIDQDWLEIKKIFSTAFRSSFHFSIATVDEKNYPHVTPIASIILGKKGKGIYFEEFTYKLRKNLSEGKQFVILAVNSGRWFWIKSLFKGKFATHPAIRLYGKAGERRLATAKEMLLWQKRVKMFSSSTGHKILWREMRYIPVLPENTGFQSV